MSSLDICIFAQVEPDTLNMFLNFYNSYGWMDTHIKEWFVLFMAQYPQT